MTESHAVSLRASIESEGYVIIPGVLDEIEMSALLYSLSNAQARRSRAGIRHLLSDSAINLFASDSRLLQISTDCLGAAAKPFRATLFDKSPESNWKVGWHQDTALPLQKKIESVGWGPWSVKEGIDYAHAPTSALQKVVALRVHLDASDRPNGPLRVLPGTDKLGVLADDEVARLANERTPVECLAGKGAILAMRPLIIHSSSKSKIETPRRVLHIEYSSSMSVGDGLELAIA